MNPESKIPSDKPFLAGLWILASFYVVMIALMVIADFAFLFKPLTGKPGMIARTAGTVSVKWAEDSNKGTISIKGDGHSESHELVRNNRYENIDGEETLVEKKDTLLVEEGENVIPGQRLTNAELTGMDALYYVFQSPTIRYSIILSLLSCTVSTIFSLWVAIPIGYIMSRFKFPGKRIIDTILDIPIVLPPLVLGISLLVLFNFAPFSWISEWVVFEVPAVILAQFMVACAFAVRTMRVTFDRIPQRYENVALTLGCNSSKAFFSVVMPQARYGIITAATLAWARSLGEFGPILVFAGSTSMRTEVLPTTVFLELQAGSLKGTLAVSMVMIVIAAIVLITARLCGMRREEAL